MSGSVVTPECVSFYPKTESNKQNYENGMTGGVYQVLANSPLWVTVSLLLAMIGFVFVLRWISRGVDYKTSYLVMLGDSALLVVIVIAIQILKRGTLVPEKFEDLKPIESFAFFGTIIFCAVSWIFDRPNELVDLYQHLVVAPALIYLDGALSIIIWVNGTRGEVMTTVILLLIGAVLVSFDFKNIKQRLSLSGLGPERG